MSKGFLSLINIRVRKWSIYVMIDGDTIVYCSLSNICCLLIGAQICLVLYVRTWKDLKLIISLGFPLMEGMKVWIGSIYWVLKNSSCIKLIVCLKRKLMKCIWVGMILLWLKGIWNGKKNPLSYDIYKKTTKGSDFSQYRVF